MHNIGMHEIACLLTVITAKTCNSLFSKLLNTILNSTPALVVFVPAFTIHMSAVPAPFPHVRSSLLTRVYYATQSLPVPFHAPNLPLSTHKKKKKKDTLLLLQRVHAREDHNMSQTVCAASRSASADCEAEVRFPKQFQCQGTVTSILTVLYRYAVI